MNVAIGWSPQEQDAVRYENKSKSKTKHVMHSAVVPILYSDTFKALIIKNSKSSSVSDSSLMPRKQFLQEHVGLRKNSQTTKQLFINACAVVTWEEV